MIIDYDDNSIINLINRLVQISDSNLILYNFMKIEKIQLEEICIISSYKI